MLKKQFELLQRRSSFWVKNNEKHPWRLQSRNVFLQRSEQQETGQVRFQWFEYGMPGSSHIVIALRSGINTVFWGPKNTRTKLLNPNPEMLVEGNSPSSLATPDHSTQPTGCPPKSTCWGRLITCSLSKWPLWATHKSVRAHPKHFRKRHTRIFEHISKQVRASALELMMSGWMVAGRVWNRSKPCCQRSPFLGTGHSKIAAVVVSTCQLYETSQLSHIISYLDLRLSFVIYTSGAHKICLWSVAPPTSQESGKKNNVPMADGSFTMFIF